MCGAGFGVLTTYLGGDLHDIGATHGMPEEVRNATTWPQRLGPETGMGRLVRGEPFVHILDAKDDQGYRQGNPVRRALVDKAGARTYLAVPIAKGDTVLGAFTIYRKEVKPFSPRQIELLQSFAAQAAIAMENHRPPQSCRLCDVARSTRRAWAGEC